MPKTITEVRTFLYPGCDRTSANVDFEAAYIGPDSKIKRYREVYDEIATLIAMGKIQKGVPFAMWCMVEDREVADSTRPASGTREVMSTTGVWSAPPAPASTEDADNAEAVTETEKVPFS